ncbi:MAG: hypothetical protein ACRETO_04140 [Gammaproteobacteria bacterium]
MIAIVVAVAVVLFGFVVMGLWNWLMPAIFGLKTISYTQAFGLLILSWILFGKLRVGAQHHGHWRHRMAERWSKMTPEEREQFKQTLREHRHHHHGEPPTEGNAG